jgi:hypothetical protein
MMLARNLLYTGVTRGKRLVVLVGQRKGSCPLTWCKSVVGHYALRRGWPVSQSATAGKLTTELSLSGVIVSSVM